jgi:hypothetical protein
MGYIHHFLVEIKISEIKASELADGTLARCYTKKEAMTLDDSSS